jgi:hypothetical protein
MQRSKRTSRSPLSAENCAWAKAARSCDLSARAVAPSRKFCTTLCETNSRQPSGDSARHDLIERADLGLEKSDEVAEVLVCE